MFVISSPCSNCSFTLWRSFHSVDIATKNFYRIFHEFTSTYRFHFVIRFDNVLRRKEKSLLSFHRFSCFLLLCCKKIPHDKFFSYLFSSFYTVSFDLAQFSSLPFRLKQYQRTSLQLNLTFTFNFSLNVHSPAEISAVHESQMKRSEKKSKNIQTNERWTSTWLVSL